MENRTLRRLCALKARVYVYLADGETRRYFTRQAMREGITYRDEAQLSNRPCDGIMALNHDGTVNFVGFAGRLAFGAAKTVGGEPLLRVDYQKYRRGEADFRYR